ncbi:MAG: hypothetical protein LBQ40_02870 [Clostridiales bacterium]|jgi:hypothetical protein|nr:hypothetical protein [Clostridiales bacterium]
MIRQWKRVEAGSLTVADREAASRKVVEWQAAQRALIKQSNEERLYLYRNSNREQIGGGTTPKMPKTAQIYRNDLTKTQNESIINIEIDKLTACVIDRKTGKEIDTKVEKIDIKEFNYKKAGFVSFDWSKEERLGHEIYALRLETDKSIQGLVTFHEEAENRTFKVDLAESAIQNRGQDGKLEGVGGNLFAFAGKQSIEKGYNHIYFASKTNLMEYYGKKFGAEFFGYNEKGSPLMEVKNNRLYELVNKYYVIDSGE